MLYLIKTLLSSPGPGVYDAPPPDPSGVDQTSPNFDISSFDAESSPDFAF